MSTIEFSAERLAAVMTGVLESAAFVFADRAESPEWPHSEALCATLVMEHGERAVLHVCAARDFGPLLAANLLGMEPDSDEARASSGDAIGELANMVAGTLAAELFGRDVISKIGVPRVLQEARADHQQHVSAAAWHVSLITEEGYRLDASLSMEEATHP